MKEGEEMGRRRRKRRGNELGRKEEEEERKKEAAKTELFGVSTPAGHADCRQQTHPEGHTDIRV